MPRLHAAPAKQCHESGRASFVRVRLAHAPAAPYLAMSLPIFLYAALTKPDLGEPPIRNNTMSIQAATRTRGEAPAATQASSGSGVEGINLSKCIPLSGLDICVSWLAPRELGIGLRCQPHGQNAAREETRWQSKRTLPCAERLTSEPGSTRQQKHCACLRTPLETRQKAAATSGSPHALGTPLERRRRRRRLLSLCLQD